MKHGAYCLAVGDTAGEWERPENTPWNGRFDCAMEPANGLFYTRNHPLP
jgi:hypothetical protein